MTVFTGITVLDVASYIAGPAAATILSDFGADVIKIEPPGAGDGQRSLASLPNVPQSAHNYGWSFPSRNKQGLALDLKTIEGQAVLHRLAASADVLITNYPLAVRPRIGLEAGALRALNPRLIYASVTGYGETGPEAHRLGFDATAYFARSGLTDITRADSSAPPVAPALAAGDHPTASTLFGAIVTALFQRERSGEGAYVSTSLLANGIWANGMVVQAALCGAEMRYRQPRTQPRSALSSFYLCADDRWFSIAMVAEDRLWPAFVAITGIEEMASDPRFATLPERRRNASALTAALDVVFLHRSAQDWQTRFEAAGFTVSLVSKPGDVANDLQARYAKAIIPAEGMEGSDFTIDSPFQIEGIVKCRPRPAPEIGQHSDDVLTSYGFSRAEIARLRLDGVVSGRQAAP